MGSYNKIIVNGAVKLDLTNDTVNENSLLYGYSAHGANGEIVSGTLFQNRPDTETLLESLDDSQSLDILDSNGESLTVGVEYINKRLYNEDILALQQTLLDLRQSLDAWRELANHTITDSNGKMIDY